MESRVAQQNPDDPRSSLAAAERARQRLATGLRLPSGTHPALAAATAIQVAAAAYGIASQSVAGLSAALAGVTVFLAVSATTLSRFRRLNGVRVDGLASQILLGTGSVATTVYVAALGTATWAAFESRWWLVAVAAVSGGIGYALAGLRWWRAYQHDPAAHAGGASPRVLVVLAVIACVGLVALIAAG